MFSCDDRKPLGSHRPAVAAHEPTWAGARNGAAASGSPPTTRAAAAPAHDSAWQWEDFDGATVRPAAEDGVSGAPAAITFRCCDQDNDRRDHLCTRKPACAPQSCIGSMLSLVQGGRDAVTSAATAEGGALVASLLQSRRNADIYYRWACVRCQLSSVIGEAGNIGVNQLCS